MSDLRTAAQQALEALKVAVDHYHTYHGHPGTKFQQAIDDLRAALAQQAEPLNLRDPAVQKRLAAQWGYAPAAQAEPDLSRCPRCNGPADNGFDRSIPPSPYLCTKCMAEPVAADALTEPKSGDKWRVEWWNESCRMMLPAHAKLDSFVAYKNGTIQFTIKRTAA